MDKFTPGPDTTRELRNALGRFATGVAVITAPGPEGPVGMTANSFASVSLEPPLVLWSPARASGRFPVFAGAGHYAIHILGAEQRDLAAHFVRHGRDFSGLEMTEGPGGAPLIGGCLARFACQREAVLDGGDHAIILGRVLEADSREGEPLVFSQGTYGRFLHAH